MSDTKAPAEAKAKKYAIKGGATQIIHPFYGTKAPITVDHLNGPNSAVFVKALKNLKPDGWWDANIIEM